MSLTPAKKLDSIGIEAICDRITAGESQQSIANGLAIAEASLRQWLAADPSRSARARAARSESARHWDDQAEKVLIGADESSPGSISIARELAHHYRWRAKCYAPKDYGDKTVIMGDETSPVTVKLMADADELLKKLQKGGDD